MSYKKIFTVMDRKAHNIIGSAGGLLLSSHEEAAVRLFTDNLQDKDTIMGKHPEDYDLLIVGSINEETGELTPVTPEIILSGQQWAALQRTRETNAQ